MTQPIISAPVHDATFHVGRRVCYQCPDNIRQGSIVVFIDDVKICGDSPCTFQLRLECCGKNCGKSFLSLYLHLARKGLKSLDWERRLEATEDLGRLAGSEPRAVVELLRVLRDQDKRVRDAAAYALAHMTPEDEGLNYTRLGEKLELMITELNAEMNSQCGTRRPKVEFKNNEAVCMPPPGAKESRENSILPRIGAFEIVLAVKDSLNSENWSEFVLFSKLDLERFPRPGELQSIQRHLKSLMLRVSKQRNDRRVITQRATIDGTPRIRNQTRFRLIAIIRRSGPHHRYHTKLRKLMERAAAVVIQSWARGVMDRCRVEIRRSTQRDLFLNRRFDATVVIQVSIRRLISKNDFIRTIEATLEIQALIRRLQPHRRYLFLMSQRLRLRLRSEFLILHRASHLLQNAVRRTQHRAHYLLNLGAARRVMACMQRMCIREKFLTLFRATHMLQMAVRLTIHRARYLQTLDAARRVMACMQRICVRENFLTLFRATHMLQMAVRRTQQRASYLIDTARIERTLEATLTLEGLIRTLEATLAIQALIRRVQPHRRYLFLMSQRLSLRLRNEFLTLHRASHQLRKAVRRTQQRARYLQTLDAARRAVACLKRMCVRETCLTLFRATHKLQMAVRRTQQRASYLIDAARIAARIERTLEATLTLESLIRTLEATLAIQALIRRLQPHRRYFGLMLKLLIVSKLHRLRRRNEFLALYRATHELQKAVRRTQHRAIYLQERCLQTQEAAARVQASIRRAITKNQKLRDHAAATRMQRFWIWHRCKPKELREDQAIEENKVYIMYHGTDKVETAALIEQQGLRASSSGLLGPGVYVSRDIRKAERYYRGSGAIFEVLVRTGRVCHIKDHLVDVHDLEGNVVREVPARDLVPDQWHDAGYDTAWVPADCSEFVFRGGAGWDQGIREETCVFDAVRITVLRRMVWETNRADVNGVQWYFEEDGDRARAHVEAHGSWVPYSRRLSIMIESHHLAYESKGGEARFVVTIESERKRFHHHTGLQYEIDLVRCTQRNVMTGYVRCLLRRDLAKEAAARVQASIRRAITKNQKLRDHAAATRMQRFWIWHRCKPKELREDQAIEENKVYIMYHGTDKVETAALIEQQGLRASSSGLLGPGVYVSRDIRKAERYYRGSGAIFEVLVRTGRVCHIKDHLVDVHDLEGNVVREVPARDLVPDQWHDAGYDTAWVPADCSEFVFRGGAGWDQGIREETCVFDAVRITVLRRMVWETNRADVNGVQWYFEEDGDRARAHVEAHGSWVPYSRRLSIMIESHHLAYESKGGEARFVVTIESERKRFHHHTGLQYEIDLVRCTQRNVMTGYVRCLLRRDLAKEAAARVQASIRRAITKNQKLRDHAAATRMQRFWIWHRCKPKELREDQAIEENKVYIMYHGTDKVETAALIEQQGLRASSSGLLGPGVYVSRDIRKAERYYRGSGAIFEVLVRTGRVCHIKDHLVDVHDLEGNVVREVPARDLVPDQWHDAGYDTAWVPADCSEFVFRGGAGWDQGIREETCVFDAVRITVLRRMVWETNRADVNGVQWYFEEDGDRARAHVEAHGSWVPYSRRLSIMIESHHLAYESKGGEARFVVTIESERKRFHHHTGLQYEIDLVRCTQRNVITGYVRCLLRRDLAKEAAARVQASIRRAITKNQKLRDHAAATRMQRFWIWHRCKPKELREDQAIEENKVYIMYHGTDKVETAALIEQQGLRASSSGLLGPGVYVSRDIRKAERYYRGSGAIFEVLVRTGRVCHIKDHLVDVHDLEGNVVREVPARDLVPDQWHDAGYDTAWVPADCSEFVFRGGAGWDQGIREETCVFDAVRITVLRRMVWETNRADVNGVQWYFEEDGDRARAHVEAHGSWVPYSRRLSIMIESHHLAYESKGGEARFVVTIESERKRFHHHTGLQYEIDLVRCTQRNVMTGYVRRLLRRDLAALHQLQKFFRRTQHRACYLQKLDAARRVIACMQRMCARKQFFNLFRATHKLQIAVRRTQQRASDLQEGDAARSVVESLRSERETALVGGEGSAEKGDSSCCSCCCC